MEPAPLRLPFRLFAGLLSLATLSFSGLALYQQFATDVDGIPERLWCLLITVVFGFAARYFGYFAFTGLPPPRPARNVWRMTFDVLFGIAATTIVLTFLYGIFGMANPDTIMVWLVTLVLVFARAVRWYWEHGAASGRRRVNDR